MGDISKHFNWSEFQCTGQTKSGGYPCGCKNNGFHAIDFRLLNILEHIRTESGIRCNINSAFRCKSRNKSEGGASSSQHLFGLAADFYIGVSGDYDKLWTPDYVVSWVRHHYPWVSHGAYNTFTHIDVRPNGPVFWDERDKRGPFPAYNPPSMPFDVEPEEPVTMDDRVTYIEGFLADQFTEFGE